MEEPSESQLHRTSGIREAEPVVHSSGVYWLIAVFFNFNTEKSHVASPGPMNVSRPALP
jgi:hypothetical protein